MDIDVIVCAKNEAKTLDAALNQILDKVKPRKLIVVYGTSKDNTKEIAMRHSDSVFWDGDEGLGAARNLGMRNSTTKIVAMIDTDVVLPKDWSEKLIRHFNDPEVAAVMGTCIYGYGCLPLQKLWEYKIQQWGTHNVLFRRRAVIKVGSFNKSVKGAGEDYDLYSRLLKAGYKWVWDKSVIVLHPMSLIEYIRHNIWWAKGVSSVRGEAPLSLSGLIKGIVHGFLEGREYFRAHPLLLFYVPIIDAIWAFAEFAGRKQKAQKNPVSIETVDINSSTQ